MSKPDWRSPTVVLVCGGIILTIAMGIRHGFGLFLQPISHDLGWGRETFALAIAVQNLVWGATQPFVGMVSDKYGAARVVMAGARAVCARAGRDGELRTRHCVFVLTSGVLLGRRSVRRHLQRHLGRARAAVSRRKSAAWRSASPPPPVRSASSRCCR